MPQLHTWQPLSMCRQYVPAATQHMAHKSKFLYCQREARWSEQYWIELVGISILYSGKLSQIGGKIGFSQQNGLLTGAAKRCHAPKFHRENLCE